MSLLNVPQSDPHDQRFIALIKKHGHAIKYVASAENDEWEPPFAYSVGGVESYGAPEIVVSGLSFDLSKFMINEFMDEWKSGKQFFLNEEYAGFLEGYPVTLLKASHHAKKTFTCFADWYYERNEFELWQMVWPGSKHGLYPWQVEDQLADVQECLVDGGWPSLSA